MMLVEKLTPEVLVSIPQRSPAVPNHDGSLALYTQTIHSIGSKTRKEIRVINIESGRSWVVVDDDRAYDAAWLDADGLHAIVFLRRGELGMTWLMFKSVDKALETVAVLGPIPGSVTDLKLKRLRDGSVGIAVIGPTNSDGSLHNPHLERAALHSAKVFDSCGVRETSSYDSSTRQAVWYSSLEQDGAYWRLAQPFKNAIKDTDLQVCAFDKCPETGLASAYAISERGIVFAAKRSSDLDTSVQHAAPVGIYHVPLYSYMSQHDPEVLELKVRSASRGICSQPKFNKDGTMIGFIHAPLHCPEDRHIYIKHVHEPSLSAISVSDMVTGHGEDWQASLVDFSFSPNGHSMYLTARDCGRIALFKLDLQPNARPRLLLSEAHGSCHAVYPLHAHDNERVLVTTSSFVENSLYQVALVDGPSVEPMPVSSLSRHGASLGLSRSQVSEIYFEGGRGTCGVEYFCQAHVLKPRNFDPARRKYPVAILVHDGPIAAWDNTWNHQWNAAVWAEQGYVVVLPNISGSTGFGLEFASSVRDSWGGRPYDDLVNLLQHLRQMPGVDTNNAVIAGAGYGGYMMNWIQGQDFGRQFKAIVSHGGIFDIPTYALTSDAPYHGPFSSHFGTFSAPIHIGNPSLLLPGSFPSAASTTSLAPARDNSNENQLQYNPEGFERYNPARPDLIFPFLPPIGRGNLDSTAGTGSATTWTTPMLILHGERDHRIPVTESLAAFRVCQSRKHESSEASAGSTTAPPATLHSSSAAAGLQRHNTTTAVRSRHLSMISLLPRHGGASPPHLPFSQSTTTQRSGSLDIPHLRRPAPPAPRPHRSRLVLFPDESHAIERPENLLEWYRQVFAWTNRWTGITARQAAMCELVAPSPASPLASASDILANAGSAGVGGSGSGGDGYTSGGDGSRSTDRVGSGANGNSPHGSGDLIDISALDISYPNLRAYQHGEVAQAVASSGGGSTGSRGGGSQGGAARPVSMMASIPSNMFQ